MSGPPETFLFIGRLHPVLVHLPIGLLLLLGMLELFARSTRFRGANSNAGLILALAVPLALFTSLCGWLLSLAGGYEDRLLQWHKWTGIGTALACVLTGAFYRADFKKSYLSCLLLTVLALGYAGHLGGSLTHGSDYLVRYAPGPIRALLGAKPAPCTPAAKESTEKGVFADVIQPILQKNCVSCHGPAKSKGKLRLDTYEGLLKGGKSGQVVVAGQPARSPLLDRIKLPLRDEDHMPPEGKLQPTGDDLALLQWWIEAGAPAMKKASELRPPAGAAGILARRLGNARAPAQTPPPKALKEMLPMAARLAEELNVSIGTVSANEPWMQCNASIAGTNFGDKELTKLASLGSNLRWLDLGGTKVSDAGLAPVAAMHNLSRLHLERTAITDAALGRLSGLSNLEYVNLYGTAVTDAGLESLRMLPNLKQVYLWQTKVTPEAARGFAEARVDRDQLQRWQQEIEQLEMKIRAQKVLVDLGTAVGTRPSTNAAAVNAQCPVSGKPADPTKTAVHEGLVVAFCCDDCKAKFMQDPKPYVSKLALSSKAAKAVTRKTK